jgi:cell wall-associated NlpC family hydrolase
MAGTQRDLASHDLWLRSQSRSHARRGVDHPASPIRRDLGDPRLWHASRHRSLERRHAAAARRRPGPPRAATASFALAVTATAVAVPALGGAVAPASASTGLTAVQRALGITADGVMGPETRAALRRFQREHGLPSVGIAGPRTRAALGLDGADAATPRAATGVARTSVVELQRRLGVAADGIVGPQTRAAISAFQREHDLAATGRLDAATRAAILQSDAPAGTPRAAAPAGEDDAAPGPAAAQGVAAAVEAARAQVGKPYRSAGKGPGGFDCSGLTAFAFRAAGVSLGASSFSQYGQGAAIERSQIQAGDLVFFNTNGPGASHVGVATGPSTMISATTHGVMEASFSSGYWAAHYVGARRVTQT